jgi:hypothetical protein
MMIAASPSCKLKSGAPAHVAPDWRRQSATIIIWKFFARLRTM